MAADPSFLSETALRPALPLRAPVGWVLTGLVAGVILPLYFAALNLPLAPLWVGLLIAATLGTMFVGDRYGHPLFAVELTLFIFIFQNTLIGLFTTAAIDPSRIVLMFGYTILLPVCCILLRLPTGWRRFGSFLPLHLFALAYLVYISVSFLLSSYPIAARIPGMRNAIAFLLIFYAAYLRLSDTLADLRRFYRMVILLVAVVVGFGFLELFVLGDPFWVTTMNITALLEAKNTSVTIRSPYPVPSDFYSPIAGRFYRRMASLIATPITLAYFLAFATLFIMFVARMGMVRRAVFSLAALAALLLTLSKGGWQMFGVGLAIYLWFYLLPPRNFAIFLTVLVGLGFLAGFLGVLIFGELGTTLGVHFDGLFGPLFYPNSTAAMLFGNGIGSGGTTAARLGADVPFDPRRGAESGIGTLLYQIGVFGVALYLIVVVLMLYALFVSLRRTRRHSRELALYPRVAIAMLGSLFVNVFVQENALAPIPISLCLICAGIGVRAAFIAPTVAAELERSGEPLHR